MEISHIKGWAVFGIYLVFAFALVAGVAWMGRGWAEFVFVPGSSYEEAMAQSLGCSTEEATSLVYRAEVDGEIDEQPESDIPYLHGFFSCKWRQESTQGDGDVTLIWRVSNPDGNEVATIYDNISAYEYRELFSGGDNKAKSDYRPPSIGEIHHVRIAAADGAETCWKFDSRYHWCPGVSQS